MENKKTSVVRKFFVTLVISFIVFALLAAAAVFGYILLNKDSAGAARVREILDSGLKDGESISNLFSPVKTHTNFLVAATDKAGALTDVMIAGTFNSKNNTISLISMPRDTYVTMPEERMELLRERGRRLPSGGAMRLNAVHSYAGPELGMEYCVKQIEDMLNIKIEYYAKVNIEAFRYIVDSIGGVEFDVPRRMKYDDPIQGLKIDLQPGLQLLDGENAEGLVRWRENNDGSGYAGGDIDRVKLQQEFVKTLIEQVTSRDDLIKNFSTLAGTYTNYVETNFPLTDLPKFLPFLNKLNMENVSTFTLPGHFGDPYWIYDEAETRLLVEEMFYETEDVVEEDAFGKNISVMNGAGKAGIASANQEKLEALGYTVTKIGDYRDGRKAYTRIFVKKRGWGKDLQALYEDSQIIYDPSLADGTDIQIVIGTDETIQGGN